MTTIISVRRDGQVALGGDGQVSLGNTILKSNAKKVRRLAKSGKVLAGFAGGTADAVTLFELFEQSLEKFHGQLLRSAIELAKRWRLDRSLQKVNAILAVADLTQSLIITGNGDVFQPEADLIAIGSGGPYGQAAALALLHNTTLSARTIVEKALEIAGRICVFTNQVHTIEELVSESNSEG